MMSLVQVYKIMKLKQQSGKINILKWKNYSEKEMKKDKIKS